MWSLVLVSPLVSRDICMLSVVLYYATATILQLFCIYITCNSNDTLEVPWDVLPIIRLNVPCKCTVKQCIANFGPCFRFIFILPLYVYDKNAYHTYFKFICSHIVFICKVSIYKNAKRENANHVLSSDGVVEWLLVCGTKDPGIEPGLTETIPANWYILLR